MRNSANFPRLSIRRSCPSATALRSVGTEFPIRPSGTEVVTPHADAQATANRSTPTKSTLVAPASDELCLHLLRFRFTYGAQRIPDSLRVAATSEYRSFLLAPALEAGNDVSVIV